VKIKRGVRKGCCHGFYLNIYSKYFTKGALRGFGDYKIGG